MIVVSCTKEAGSYGGGLLFLWRLVMKKVMIENEAQLSLEHIGRIIDNAVELKRHLGEPIMYETQSGICLMLVIDMTEENGYQHWYFKRAMN